MGLGLGLALASWSAQAEDQDWLDSLLDEQPSSETAAPSAGSESNALPTIAVPQATPAPRPRAQGRQLEEIVVTARRREEGLQDTPVAVSAISGEQLSELGITTLADVRTVSPSLQFASSLEKSPSIFIRGIGQRSASFALDPGVGLYLNGIYIPRQDTQLLDAVDVAGIQVLRGPQGTLFGKNNIGGALLVDTQRPTTDGLTAAFTGTVGDFGRRGARLSANLPLSDSLAARVAFDAKRLDGFIRNADGGPNLLDEHRWGLSGRVLWQASDVLEVDLFAYVSQTRERGLPVSCRLQDPDAIVQLLLYRDADFPNASEACLASEALAGEAVYQTAGAVVYELSNHITALTLRYDAGWGSAQSITSWSFQDDFARGTDPDGSATGAIQGGSVAGRRIIGASSPIPDELRDQLTQEVKLDLSLFDDQVDLTAGLFAARESMDNAVFGANIGESGFAGVTIRAAGQQVLTGPLAIPLPSLADFIGQEGLVFPFFGNFDYVSDLVNDTYALFAQMAWRFSDNWEFTAGARYTVEERYRNVRSYVADFNAYAAALNAQIGSDPAILLPVTHLQGGIFSPVTQAQFLAYAAPQAVYGDPAFFEGRVRFSRLTPTFTLSYQVPDNWALRVGLDRLLAYATYSEGFKSGGLEIRGISALSQFDPEVVSSRELGIKLDALDSRLRVNAALYHLDYRNLQVELAEAGEGVVSSVLFLDNAGSARVVGVELEATALLGNWTLQGSFAHTNGRFEDYTLLTNTSDGLRPVDRSGEPFPLVPENTASLVVQYDWQTRYGRVMPLLQAYYRDSLFTGLDFAAIQYASSTIPEQATLNARLAFMPHERLRITGFVNNVTDERYFVGGAAVSDQIGVATHQPAPPRHVGLELYYRFE
jgi:iron complex outermembrane receptor protein